MRSHACAVLGFGAPVMLLALLVGGQVGTWLFVAVSPTFPVALIVLGAAGRPRARGRVLALALILGVSLELGALGILILHGATDPAPVWLGLPAATWLMLVALGLLPLAAVPLAYAALFEPTARDEVTRAGTATNDRQP